MQFQVIRERFRHGVLTCSLGPMSDTAPALAAGATLAWLVDINIDARRWIDERESADPRGLAWQARN